MKTQINNVTLKRGEFIEINNKKYQVSVVMKTMVHCLKCYPDGTPRKNSMKNIQAFTFSQLEKML